VCTITITIVQLQDNLRLNQLAGMCACACACKRACVRAREHARLCMRVLHKRFTMSVTERLLKRIIIGVHEYKVTLPYGHTEITT
jgi:hypothetical protein